MWDGMPTVVPIGGYRRNGFPRHCLPSRSFRVRGTDAILWNAVGVILLLVHLSGRVASGLAIGRRSAGLNR